MKLWMSGRGGEGGDHNETDLPENRSANKECTKILVESAQEFQKSNGGTCIAFFSTSIVNAARVSCPLRHTPLQNPAISQTTFGLSFATLFHNVWSIFIIFLL